MDVAVLLVGLEGFRLLGEKVPAVGVPLVQLGDHLFDLQVILVALVGLQGGDELFHLAQGLLVVDGQEHPGLDIQQLGGHGDKLAGHLQVQLLALVHPGQVLVQNQGDLDVLDLHFIFAQQMENQVQRTCEVLQVLGPGLHHPLQMIDRTVQSYASRPLK